LKVFILIPQEPIKYTPYNHKSGFRSQHKVKKDNLVALDGTTLTLNKGILSKRKKMTDE